jgi:hypothetical protein
VAALLALGAAFQTYVLTERTDDYFAWPIEPPITAAFLGGCYLASVTLLGISSRVGSWVEGRLAAPPVMVGALFLLTATLIHLDLFEKDHPVFWFWLAAYVLVPPVLLVFVLNQLRAPGEDPPPRVPLPGWARAGLALHAALLLGFGALMFAFPGAAEDIWPWTLTPLTSQALGAFLLAFGVTAAFAVRDNELTRLRGAALAYTVFGAAELIAVARYTGDIDFDDPAAWLYFGFMATVLLGGLALLALLREANLARRPGET